MAATHGIKPVIWIGSARADLSTFPEEVKDSIGFALYVAQQGGKHPDAKPLRGFGGAVILEIVEDHHGDTYRAVYTVRLADQLDQVAPQTSRGRARRMASASEGNKRTWVE